MRVIQYWDSGEPPAYLAESMASFRTLNPEFPHDLYDERRAGELIAERFGERERDAFAACAVPAMRSDYFRCCAVLALGGAYADVAFRCVAQLAPLLDAPGGVLFRRMPRGYFFNGFFAFGAPGHPLLRLALDVATANVERRASQMVQMVTGPWIFSGLGELHRLCSLDGGGDLGRLLERFRAEVPPLAPTPAGRAGIAPMIEPLFETVGDVGRLLAAFADVRVASYEEMTGYVREPDAPLPYKRAQTDWIPWQRSGRTIFR